MAKKKVDKANSIKQGDIAVGTRIRVVRLINGMGVVELATRMGIYASQLSNIENNKVKPSTKNLEALESIFNIPVDRWTGGIARKPYTRAK